jgi:hypothetical protein
VIGIGITSRPSIKENLGMQTSSSTNSLSISNSSSFSVPKPISKSPALLPILQIRPSPFLQTSDEEIDNVTELKKEDSLK